MEFRKKILITAAAICLPLSTSAAQLTFDFTGRLVVADAFGTIFGPAFTPISASLTYDTNTGVGGSDLSITTNGAGFLGPVPTFHDITMQRQGNSNTIIGNVLVDWSGATNMDLHIEWDASGLFNALALGMSVGDTISGTTLYRDSNGSGTFDLASEFIADVGSAIPYSDSLAGSAANPQGPAPIAATSGSLGLGPTTPFPFIRGYFDIGSGNSIHLTAAVVPIPAAVWLFGSALLGLIGAGRHRRQK